MRKIFSSVLSLTVALSVNAQVWVEQENTQPFEIYQSTCNHEIKPIRSTPFSRHGYSMLTSIDLDDAPVSHDYLGAGVSLTDATCYLLSQMSDSLRDSIIRESFTKQGINLNIARLNCGSSDYATELYNYDSFPGDVQMKHFSIARDKRYMIPMIKRIQDFCPDLFKFASIWSCPEWMKTNGAMCGGGLKEEYEKAFAAYWVAYIKAYKNQGIDIQAMTVQNEPLTDQYGGCPACRLRPGQEERLAGKYLPEAFQSAGIKTKIWIYDHNYYKKSEDYIIPLLSDKNVQKNATAIAWHPYYGDVSYIDEIHEQFPMFEMHLTERGSNLILDDIQTECWFAKLMFEAYNHGCKSYTAFNLVLDPDGQPCTGRFTCEGLFTYDMDTHKITRSRQYPVFRHFAPFVQQGASVLSIVQPDPDLVCIAFRNPDGSEVVCVANPGIKRERKRVQIKHNGEFLTLCLPIDTWSLTTVVIK